MQITKQTLFKSLLRMKRKQHCHNNTLDHYVTSQKLYLDTLNCLGSYDIANGMEWYRTTAKLAYLAHVCAMPHLLVLEMPQIYLLVMWKLFCAESQNKLRKADIRKGF